MKFALPLFFLCLAACNSLPAGQGDGGISGAESDQLNEAAEILDTQKAPPPIEELAAPAPKGG